MNKICAVAGCKSVTTKRHCSKHAVIAEKANKQRAKARAVSSNKRYDPKFKAFYSSPEWKRLRDIKIRANPLCQDCLVNKIIKPAMDVDHVEELKSNWSLRLQYSNLRCLCRSCHMVKTRLEKLGRQK
ncbi:MAG: endonuclease [Robiginitomaculum sp.]|nr:MAG: endonuclease [Robiginitomaculum sp.]